MRLKTVCFLALVLVGVWAAALLAQTEKNYCPLTPEEQSVIAPQPQGQPVMPTKGPEYTVSRKQVLIEAFTRTG